MPARSRQDRVTFINRWERIEGTPFPFGGTWIEEEQAFNFSLYSKHEGVLGDWQRVVDTARESPDDFVESDGRVNDVTYHANARSVVVLLRSRDA